MECSRCGGEAVVKRDNAVYCGKCALARDWQEIIHVVQQDRVTLNSKPTGQPAAARPESAPPGDEISDAPAAPISLDAQPVTDSGEGGDGPKADPFA